MTKFTKSISILALTASLAVIAPGELPSADNDFNLWAEAEAGNIKRARVTRKKLLERAVYKEGLKRNELRKYVDPENVDEIGDTVTIERLGVIVSTDTDNSDANFATEVAVDVSVIDPNGVLLPVHSKTIKKPEWVRFFFIWTPPTEFEGGDVTIAGYNQIDTVFAAPSEIGVTNTEINSDTSTTLNMTRQSNGDYLIEVEGLPENMDDLCLTTSTKGNGQVCGSTDHFMTVNGDETAFSETAHVWLSDLSGRTNASDIEGVKHFISTTTYNEVGEILDKSTTSGVVDEEEQPFNGEELDYAEFRVVGLEEVISYPKDPMANASLDVKISSDDFGTDLIDEVEVPATRYREFIVPDLKFFNFDDVVDQEYEINVVVWDELGNMMAESAFVVTGIEAGDENFLNDYIGYDQFGDDLLGFGQLQQNTNGETFDLYLGFEGSTANLAASVSVAFTVGSGSDSEFEEYETSESIFENVWSIESPLGPEAYELFLASDAISYDFVLKSDGKITDISGGLNDGISLGVNGFGKGTKKSTIRASARAELQ